MCERYDRGTRASLPTRSRSPGIQAVASYRPAESVTDTRELLAMPTRKFSRFDDEQEGREQVDEVQLTTGSEAPRSSEADDTFDEVAEQPIDEAAGQPEPEQPASRRKSRCC